MHPVRLASTFRTPEFVWRARHHADVVPMVRPLHDRDVLASRPRRECKPQRQVVSFRPRIAQVDHRQMWRAPLQQLLYILGKSSAQVSSVRVQLRELLALRLHHIFAAMADVRNVVHGVQPFDIFGVRHAGAGCCYHEDGPLVRQRDI
jgi:hypothetical protein